MFVLIYNLFQYIGTAAILILISYLFVDLYNKKKVTLSDVVSHVLVLVLLFFVLLRT